jgi:eukaryotic-like serine/threonine-protein kinase
MYDAAMQPGDIVAGRFEVERLADSGAMASVYRARDHQTGAPVALKMLGGLKGDDSERFKREAEVLSSIRHPAIVQYVAHGKMVTGTRYLAMEWLDGENLAQRIRRQGLTVDETLSLGRRVAEGLGAAHRRGVIHRDIKPSNLFLPGGSIERAKIVDFGIARASGPYADLTLTGTGAMIGTPGYMAPEQARGEPDVDARADVFALGCVMFMCLTGQRPFAGKDMLTVLARTVLDDVARPSALREDIPPELDALILRMMAKSPARRPVDGMAVRAELMALGPISGRRAPTLPHTTGQALTITEQRVLCVVLARPTPGIGRGAVTGTVTFSASQIQERIETLRKSAETPGSRVEVLAEGSVLVTIGGGGAATDRAACAARCALSMRDALPDAPLSLATGRGRAGMQAPVGEVLDRAIELIRTSEPPSALASQEGAPRGLTDDDPTLPTHIWPIRIDEVTAGLLGTRFLVGSDETGLFLRGERDISVPQRTLLSKPTTCVGRDRELATLTGLFEECIGEPRARVVVVTGSAGIGKSRLLHEFLSRIEQIDGEAEVWMSQGDPMRAGSPFGMIAPAVRRSAGVLEGEPPSLRRRKLRARLARHMVGGAGGIGAEPSTSSFRGPAAWPVPSARDLPRITEFIGELVGVPFPDDDSVQLRAARRDAVLMNDQMRRAWEDLRSAACAVHPLVLVVEDLHWGDLPSVKFIDAALRTLRDAPLMVLAIARPEVERLFPDLWSEREPQVIRLSSLGRKASERIVRGALGPSVSDELVARLLERAEGNAFYLEELIRAVAEGQGDRLPETVLAMVQERLDALEPDARRVLRAASVFGDVFWRGGVGALLGGQETALEIAERLKMLADREIVTRRGDGRFPGEEEYAFRHTLVREATYAMLTEEDRALGHRLAGAWLERAGETGAIVLAEHLERGGERARAASWYQRAAEEALGANDFAAAIERAGRGAACGADGEALGALRLIEAEAHKWRAENAETAACGTEAMQRLPRGSPPWYAATGEVAVASLRMGRVGQLVETARELRAALAEGGAGPAAVAAAARAATGLSHAGAHELVDALLELAERLAEQLQKPDPAVAARVLQARGTQALIEGDAGGYLQRMSSAATRFDEAGDVRMACNARVGVGYGYLEIGAYAGAERCFRETLASAERMGLPQVVAAAKHNLGLVLARRGAVTEAGQVETEAVEAFCRQGDARMEAASRSYLAIILVAAGDLDAAAAAARAAAALSVPAPVRAQALASLAHVRLAAGCAEEALAATREAMELLASLGGVDTGESFLRLTHAEALFAAGDTVSALEAAELARQRLLDRAAKIKDAGFRASFLEQVPENARTLELASLWRAETESKLG